MSQGRTGWFWRRKRNSNPWYGKPYNSFRAQRMLPDGRKAASPKATSQPRKDFLPRNKLDLSALNLADAALDFRSPGFVGAFLRRTIERLDPREHELGTFHLGQPRCLFLQLCKRLGHMTFVL